MCVYIYLFIFCSFVEFRNDGMEDSYSILIRFDSQDSTDNFYKHFNGSRFSSLEVCFTFIKCNIHIHSPIHTHILLNESYKKRLTNNGNFLEKQLIYSIIAICIYFFYLNIGGGLYRAFHIRCAIHWFN